MYICPKLLIKKIPKMKKLIYLFAAVIMFAFIACGGADTATEQAAPAAEEVVAEEEATAEAAE